MSSFPRQNVSKHVEFIPVITCWNTMSFSRQNMLQHVKFFPPKRVETRRIFFPPKRVETRRFLELVKQEQQEQQQQQQQKSRS